MNGVTARKSLLWTIAGTTVVLAVALFPRMVETASESIAFSGTFEQETMPVHAKSVGRVREVCVHEGDPVEAGQVLLRLDDGELRARYQRAQGLLADIVAGADIVSSLKAAPRRVVDQMIELNPEVRAAESDYVEALQAYEDAQSSGADAAAAAAHQKLENATRRRTEIRRQVSGRVSGLFASADDPAREMKHDLDLLETQLAAGAVTAPCNGSVDILQLHPGDIVLPGQPVAALAVAGQYYVNLHVSRAQLPMFQVGRRVLVGVGPGSARTTRGDIGEIAQSADLPILRLSNGNRSQTFAVKIRVSNPPARALPGMRATIRMAGTSE